MKKIISMLLIAAMLLSLSSCSKAELEEKTKQIEKLTGEKDVLENLNMGLKAQLEDAEKQIKDLEKELETQAKNTEKLNKKIDDMQKKLDEVSKELDDMKKEKEEAKKAEEAAYELGKAGKKFEDFYKANTDKGINGMGLLKLAQLAFDMSFEDASHLDIGNKFESHFEGGKFVQYNNNIAFFLGDSGSDVGAIQVSGDFNSQMMGMKKSSIHTMFGDPKTASKGEDMLTGDIIDTESYEFSGYSISIFYSKKTGSDVIEKVMVFKG